MRVWWWLIVLGAVSLEAGAHKPSDSYLRIKVIDERIEGRWDVPLRDLDYLIDLDADGDGRIRWGEVRQRESEVIGLLQGHLAIEADGVRCRLDALPLQVTDLADGTGISLPLAGRCANVPETLTVRYGLLFEVDPQHRGLLQLDWDDASHVGVFSPQRRALTHVRDRDSLGATFAQFFVIGARHIAIGLDHLLFLAGLLLPAVVWRERGGWQAASDARQAWWGVVRIVTAFTLAHALTLSLASLDLLRVPTRLTESLVAATIVFAALNNLWPMVRRRLWTVAFGFGLIHGAGYASVLGDLGLQGWMLVTALLAFNLGVEGMQVAVAALWVPLAYRLRQQPVYQWGVVGFGSLLVAMMGLVWLLERSLNLRFIG